jgi:hypothetical protein
MPFNEDFLRAEAIREVRASGATMPGVAELIVEFHGANKVLGDVAGIQKLGEEAAASDTEIGAKLRALLGQQAVDAKTLADEKALNEEAQRVAAEQHAPVVEVPPSGEPVPVTAGEAPAEGESHHQEDRQEERNWKKKHRK